MEKAFMDQITHAEKGIKLGNDQIAKYKALSRLKIIDQEEALRRQLIQVVVQNRLEDFWRLAKFLVKHLQTADEDELQNYYTNLRSANEQVIDILYISSLTATDRNKYCTVYFLIEISDQYKISSTNKQESEKIDNGIRELLKKLIEEMELTSGSKLSPIGKVTMREIEQLFPSSSWSYEVKVRKCLDGFVKESNGFNLTADKFYDMYIVLSKQSHSEIFSLMGPKHGTTKTVRYQLIGYLVVLQRMMLELADKRFIHSSTKSEVEAWVEELNEVSLELLKYWATLNAFTQI